MKFILFPSLVIAFSYLHAQDHDLSDLYAPVVFDRRGSESQMLRELSAISDERGNHKLDDAQIFEVALGILESTIPDVRRRTKSSMKWIGHILERYSSEVAALPLPAKMAICMTSSYCDFITFRHRSLDEENSDSDFKHLGFLTSVALLDSSAASERSLRSLFWSSPGIVATGVLAIPAVQQPMMEYLGYGYYLIFFSNLATTVASQLMVLRHFSLERKVIHKIHDFMTFLIAEDILNQDELRALNLKQHSSLCSWFLSAQSIAQKFK